MKKYGVPVIIIISCLLSGCEDSVVNNNLTDVSKNIVVVKELEQDQQVVEEETKNLVVLPIKEIKVVRKKVVKAKTKFVAKSAKSEIEESPALVEVGQKRRALDLTLPAEIKYQIALNTKSYQKQAYLPDLFPGNKKKKYGLQVDGKMLDREEKEADKVSSIDGVGIDVRLYP